MTEVIFRIIYVYTYIMTLSMSVTRAHEFTERAYMKNWREERKGNNIVIIIAKHHQKQK